MSDNAEDAPRAEGPVVTGLPIPDARKLTRRQHQGWDCVWCGTSLWHGAVKAGRAVGSIGAVDLSIDVYACPRCAQLHIPAADRPGGDK